MEVFARHVPDQIKEKQLKRAFAPILAELSINTYLCRKLRNNCATVTIADAAKAQKFLDLYECRNVARPPLKTLTIHGKRILLSQSKNKPDELLIRSLQEEERTKATKVPNIRISEPKKVQKKFAISALSCGLWDYYDNEPVFVKYFQVRQSGELSFGRSSIMITLHAPTGLQHDIVCDYYTLGTSIFVGNSANPTVTLTLQFAPKVYEKNELAEMMKMLGLAPRTSRTKKTYRVETLGAGFDLIGGVCLAYQLDLTRHTDIGLLHFLKEERHIPTLTPWLTQSVQPEISFQDQMVAFMSALCREELPYQMKYQLQMLVWNGIIAPSKVAILVPEMQRLINRVGIDQATKALRRMARELQYPGPEAEGSTFSMRSLMETIYQAARKVGYESYDREQSTSRSLALIYKATVTPIGIYLYGPNWEPTNRVLRKYLDHTDQFLRVEFSDEAGDPVTYDQGASLEFIYKRRFKTVMQTGILVGGRHFHFLGFSHSSLRAQSCWFVAAFTTARGDFINADTIIQRLGDFSKITSPAKTAARIGQAFSDTFASIEISEQVVELVPDIERAGRVFSDGVGTLSESLMRKIWKAYAPSAKLKPKVFQIRCGGAKGMVSLDSRLEGDVLRLREPSMVKYKTTDTWNIEVCGSGLRVLPMYLNRQLIKILEDLDVFSGYLLEMQQEEVDKLQEISQSPVLAANFLEKANLAQATKTPFLIRTLVRLKIPFLNDEFLRRMLELAVLVRLRELKYRARIRVDEGVTLYGIMDETDTLREGEIYCPIVSESGQMEILVGRNLVITRAPALHPGDIQLVNAVDVPENSPLRQLHNCIVFSQRGERDLPSKLSGGDLDGDLYNIIYDHRLVCNKAGRPLQTAIPADYPRVEQKPLGRPVHRDDIIDHFLTFMEQDQLGHIAITHQVVADQKVRGTFDEDCLVLAQLHSTAVDFSKSGIPADMSQMPRYQRIRPDFMAPSPRVRIEGNFVELIKKLEEDPERDEEDEGPPSTRYYESTKILGQLFRRIDEDAFLYDIRASTGARDLSAPDPFRSLWAYISRETSGCSWAHYIEEAEEIKELYEDNLKDLMYQYSQSPWASTLDELEVFIGNIVGKSHNLSSRQREASSDMREDYNALVEYTTGQIRNKEGARKDALERSIACFFLGLDENQDEHEGVSLGRTVKIKLRSFRWIAAAICLQEVERLQKSR